LSADILPRNDDAHSLSREPRPQALQTRQRTLLVLSPDYINKTIYG